VHVHPPHHHPSHRFRRPLRETLSVQRRATASFKQKVGGKLHVRKATQPEPRLKAIYTALMVNPLPGGTKRLAE
jgi:hypothetical protein